MAKSLKMNIGCIFFLFFFSSFNSYAALNIANQKIGVVNVKDFGAIPNDENEDTKAIQAAFDYAKSKNINTVFFSKGTYIVNNVTLDHVVKVTGELGAILKKTSGAGKWSRMFTITRDLNNLYGEYIIENLIFDGNLQKQGPYQRFQLEQQHLIFVFGDNKRKERVNITVRNCKFYNSVADGISIYTNVNAKLFNCVARDIFRGGFVITGGNSIISVRGFNIEKGVVINDVGFDVEVDGNGFYGNKKVSIDLQDIRLYGKFHIGVLDSSSVIASNINAIDSEFYIYAPNSKVEVANSNFLINYSKRNEIYFPKNVKITKTNFTLTKDTLNRKLDPERMFYLVWKTKNSSYSNDSLTFTDCTFQCERTDSKNVVVFFTDTDDLTENNILVINNCNVSSTFTEGIRMLRGGRISIKGGLWDPQLPFYLMSQQNFNRQYDVRMDGITFGNNVQLLLKTNAVKGNTIFFKNTYLNYQQAKIQIFHGIKSDIDFKGNRYIKNTEKKYIDKILPIDIYTN